uniref:Uncharacterized protein n=1 Tax=Oryza punctata TaxID=4537 RepID=A0A0E0L3R8_ORYPU
MLTPPPPRSSSRRGGEKRKKKILVTPFPVSSSFGSSSAQLHPILHPPLEAAAAAAGGRRKARIRGERPFFPFPRVSSRRPAAAACSWSSTASPSIFIMESPPAPRRSPGPSPLGGSPTMGDRTMKAPTPSVLLRDGEPE